MGLSKYIGFFWLECQRIAEFKFDFLLFWVETLFRINIVLLFWLAVFQQAELEWINQLDQSSFLGLLLVTRILSLPIQNGDGISLMIEEPVVSGSMTGMLCRPVHPIWMNFTRVLVDRLRMLALAILILLISMIVLVKLELMTLPEMNQVPWVPFVLSLMLGLFIHFYLYTILGLFSFWIGRVWSILYIVGVLNIFLAGFLFPLETVPWVDTISRFLPFRYCAYSSASIFWNRGSVAFELGSQALMLLCCFTITAIFWKVSLKKFESAGG